MKKLIYLDNAATTFPKPPSVISAVESCLRTYCGNPSRGSNPLAMRCSEVVYNCRELLGKTFSCSPENIAFTYNTTYAINMALKGILKQGDHVLISDMEHNAVLRPVEQMRRDGMIEYDIFRAYGFDGDEVVADIDRKKRHNTRAVCCLHASNICSYILPIEKIGKYCRENNLIFICDGAQSAGHIPIDIKRYGIDVLCLPHHKGLYGIQGGGVMLCADGISPESVIQGGNGVFSLDPTMGDSHPEKYEAGTQNTPACAGLCEGLRYLKARGIESIGRQNKLLFEHARRTLSSIPGVELYDSTPGAVMLFGIRDMISDEVGDILGHEGICVRCGYHCAPLAHASLGTPDGGGVRISFGTFNTPSQINYLASVIEDISSRKYRL